MRNRRFANTTLAAIGLLACFWGIWMSGRVALSRQLASHVKSRIGSGDSADRAISLSPSDPKAFYVRGLSKRDRITEAVSDFETAVVLRPDDHFLWLWLGYARDRVGNQAGALLAYQEAVRLAPYYAQPRWYLGKVLLRAERHDEAFAELRLAVRSRPNLLIDTINRAWRVYGGDTSAVEAAIQPQTAAARMTLARFFVQHGNVTEAMTLFRNTQGASPTDRRPLFEALLGASHFHDAYEVWASGTGGAANAMTIINGGFEEPIALEQRGFGWQLFQSQRGIQVALDPAERRTGSQSLRVDWSGHSDTLLPIASQLVLVEPGRRYQLRCAARGADLVMLGLPAISVVDASDPAASSGDYRQSALGYSQPLPKGTSGWQEYSLDFTTSAATRAVIIRLHRENCAIHPCPAFGHAWFDDFSLVKLTQ